MNKLFYEKIFMNLPYSITMDEVIDSVAYYPSDIHVAVFAQVFQVRVVVINDRGQ